MQKGAMSDIIEIQIGSDHEHAMHCDSYINIAKYSMPNYSPKLSITN